MCEEHHKEPDVIRRSTDTPKMTLPLQETLCTQAPACAVVDDPLTPPTNDLRAVAYTETCELLMLSCENHSLTNLVCKGLRLTTGPNKKNPPMKPANYNGIILTETVLIPESRREMPFLG